MLKDKILKNEISKFRTNCHDYKIKKQKRDLLYTSECTAFCIGFTYIKIRHTYNSCVSYMYVNHAWFFNTIDWGNCMIQTSYWTSACGVYKAISFFFFCKSINQKHLCSKFYFHHHLSIQKSYMLQACKCTFMKYNF